MLHTNQDQGRDKVNIFAVDPTGSEDNSGSILVRMSVYLSPVTLTFNSLSSNFQEVFKFSQISQVTHFFYKNIVYKNVPPQIGDTIKNILMAQNV